MSLTQSQALVLLILIVIAAASLPSAYAFGAGNVPSFSFMEGKAFRHGDLEDILTQLLKKTGGGLFGRGSKFGGLDVKRIYFGNWLRDYSQAMDIAALEKMAKQTILNLVMVLGFMAHGYATGEFEVTSERLGVYLPTEHIDNPKGYGEGKNAKSFDSRLRGPIDPRELEVDPRSGMKNYIANETGNWDTSSALVRRTVIQCITLGRQARRSGDEKQLYEAYRLLGQLLHTCEDLPAHSNWCELALYRLGHRQVFLHVGDNVKVRAPDGTSVTPLITGTFGGADFMHSLLGEAQDHLSEASVSDLNKAVSEAKSRGSNPVQDLLSLISNVPGGSSASMTRDAEALSRGPNQDPSTMSPQEVYKNLFAILSFRDGVMMWIEKTIEKIPGLNALVEKASNALSVFVFTLIEPYVQPIMRQAMGGLHMTSAEVIKSEDQYEVFDNPTASDPTHSMLSKDHFGLVLNEVAGRVAIIIVRHCTNLIVKAWDDEKLNPAQVADECLAPFFHPFWFDKSRCHKVQEEMMNFVAEWANNNHNEIVKLDRQHVRAHTNTRSGKAEAHSHGESAANYNYGGVQIEGQQGVSMGNGMAHSVQSYVGGKVSGAMGSHNVGQGIFREGPQDVASTTPASSANNFSADGAVPSHSADGQDGRSTLSAHKLGSAPQHSSVPHDGHGGSSGGYRGGHEAHPAHQSGPATGNSTASHHSHHSNPHHSSSSSFEHGRVGMPSEQTYTGNNYEESNYSQNQYGAPSGPPPNMSMMSNQGYQDYGEHLQGPPPPGYGYPQGYYAPPPPLDQYGNPMGSQGAHGGNYGENNGHIGYEGGYRGT
ncbi:hypothetical protein CBS101457_003369 [Exobasidium rhododendri]|nr:hypothetical protein CBS101457_003369 [Exobasidium rhododendri]